MIYQALQGFGSVLMNNTGIVEFAKLLVNDGMDGLEKGTILNAIFLIPEQERESRVQKAKTQLTTDFPEGSFKANAVIELLREPMNIYTAAPAA